LRLGLERIALNSAVRVYQHATSRCNLTVLRFPFWVVRVILGFLGFVLIDFFPTVRGHSYLL